MVKERYRSIGSTTRRLVVAASVFVLLSGFGPEHTAPIAVAESTPPKGSSGVETPIMVASLQVSELEDLPALPPAATAIRRRAYASEGGALALDTVFGGVDVARWREVDHQQMAGIPTLFEGVDFPHVASRKRPLTPLRRSYLRMVVWSVAVQESGQREPIANIHCMGLKPAAVARRAEPYEPLILELAMQHGVSASLIKAIISVESCFDPTAESHVGAIGLMQLMPETAAWLKAGDPRQVENNLRAGIRYFASLHKTFGDTALALAAYNAGPGNVRRYGGIPPFTETRHYVKKVMASHRRYVAATALAVGGPSP